jgi:allantoate deiminase
MALRTSQHSAVRTMERLEQLAGIGRMPGRSGVTRPGLSALEQQACELVARWMDEAGLAVSWDAAGNLFGRLPGADPDLPETWAGSHLDTVPDGGRFDGALGVVVALEAVSRVAAHAESTVAVVVFRDEEGWRFGNGCFGSRAVCGLLTAADLALTDPGGTSVGQALAALGLGPEPRAGRLPRHFVEVHIEQGPRLEREDRPLAVVTAIAGMAGFSCTFHGAAGHAGTVPMPGRGDAFAACAEFALRLRERALSLPGAVATIGDVRIDDPASNVIPGRVRATVDVRAPAAETLAVLAQETRSLAVAAAGDHGCTVEMVERWLDQPVPLSPVVTGVLRAEAEALRLPLPDLPSGAGHDAGVLAAAGVESGMLFVRSRNGGVSHRPDELSDEADIAAAIEVLTGALSRLR